MLDRLTRWLRAAPPLDPERQARLALAALLVRIARVDGDYSELEARMICGFVAARFAMRPSEADELVKDAEAHEQKVGDTVHLTRKVKDVIALDDRPALLAEMWQIVLSDDERHEEENGLMRLITSLLGLPDRESARARQAVMGQRGL